jgi:LuxR family maltose regulon positive regulatory protein
MVGQLFDPSTMRAPRLPSRVLHRERLFRKLDRRHALTLVHGPAGFGKTTLVADWVQQRSEPALWLRLVDGVLGDTASCEIFAALAAAFGAGRNIERASLTQAVFQGATQLSGAVTVVIDKYERSNEPELDDLLIELLQRAPLLHLIVLGSTLAGLPTTGPQYVETTVIEPAELAFTPAEVESLTTRSSIHPSPALASTLHDALAGWPAAIRAAIDDLAETPEASTPAALNTVVRKLSIPVHLLNQTRQELESTGSRAAIVATSILEDLTPQTLAAAAPREEPVEFLERLRSLGYILPTGDGNTPNYQMIPALKRALRQSFERDDPALVRKVERKVAEWYRAGRDPGRALGHAVRARDWALAVDVVTDDWMRLGGSANSTDGDDLAGSAAGGRSASSLYRVGAVQTAPIADESLVASLSGDLESLTLLARSPAVDEVISVATVQSLILRVGGDVRGAAKLTSRIEEIARQASRSGPDVRDANVSGTLSLQWGLTHLLAGEIHSALHAFDQAFAMHAQHGDAALASRNAAGSALTLVLAGEPILASTWLETRRALGSPITALSDPIRSAARAAHALVALDGLDQNEAERALAALSDTQLEGEFAFATALALGEFALAQKAHRGTTAHRLAQLRANQRASSERGGIADSVIAATMANLYMAVGQANAASAVLAEVGDSEPYAAIAAARLALLCGKTDAALRISSRELRKLDALPRTKVSMGLIKALAHERDGNSELAVLAVSGAIDAALKSGLIRTFATVPRQELELVTALTPGGSEILRQLDAAGVGEVFPTSLHLAELTKREQIVLSALARELTLQDIAAELFVSVNTVKTQARAIYQKLEVHSRSEAIERGFEWGLLESPAVID